MGAVDLLQYSIILARKKAKQVFSVTSAICGNHFSIFPGFNEQLEKQFSRYCNDKHTLSFCNGTSAIEAALFAVGVGPGDEVIVPSCTFHATIDPICNLGAQPIFADVDKNTFTICPKDIRNKITSKTKAVMVTHLFGIPAAMKEICEVARQANIDIIEDCSHAHGAQSEAQLCGTIGRIGAFSLQGGKAVAAGEGGITVSSLYEDKVRMSLFAHFGLHAADFDRISCQPFSMTGIGHKRRIASLSAALAIADLAEIDRVNRLLRKGARLLDEELGTIEGVRIPRLPEGSQRGGCFLGYPFSVAGTQLNSKILREEFRKLNVDLTLYPFARHHQFPIYNDLSYRQKVIAGRMKTGNLIASSKVSGPSLSNTEALESSLVILPRRFLIKLSRSEIKKMGDTLRTLMKRETFVHQEENDQRKFG